MLAPLVWGVSGSVPQGNVIPSKLATSRVYRGIKTILLNMQARCPATLQPLVSTRTMRSDHQPPDR